LIERVIERLFPITQKLIIVTAPGRVEPLTSLLQLKTKVTVDLYPGKGALGGIYTGLTEADTFYSLIVACDMPFLDPALLRYLATLAPGFDLVVPRVKGMVEPLHAIYSKNCLAVIEQLLSRNELQIARLFSLVKTRYVGEIEVGRFDPGYLSFFNINTIADLKRVRVLLRQNKDHTLAKG